MKTNDPSAELFAAAFRQHQAGALREAEHNRKAIGLKPDYAEAYLNLGNALKAKDKFEEAKSNYEKAIALKPELATAHFNLANVLADEGALGEAASHYEKAL